MTLQADCRGDRRTWAAVSLDIGGGPRTLALRGWLSAGLASAGAVFATWYLGATLYLVFHDQLLAALMARQTAAQYEYEDRIANLSVQLDQQTSRALLDRQRLETSVRELQERSERLAARAAMIDRLVARERSPAAGQSLAPRTSGPTADISPRSGVAATSRNPLPQGRAGLPTQIYNHGRYPSPPVAATGDGEALQRLDDEGEVRKTPEGPDRRADRESDAETDRAVAARLAGVERAQGRALAVLREPAFDFVAKLKTALAEAGVSPATPRDRESGGPFVPLSGTALTFEQDAALVQDALLQAGQLQALADRVPLRPPVSGPLQVTSSFGPRLDPFYGRPALHTGVDLRGVAGAEVHATAGGTVSFAASEGGYGTMVEVNHGDGLVTRYAHLASASVVQGQHVEPGGVIGRVGSTGRATGPHLHYETRVNGEPVDPVRFLKAGAKIFDVSERSDAR